MNTENLFSLDDKVVVLTGGSGLIGKEVAFGLSRFGAKLVVGVRDVNNFEIQLESIQLPDKCHLPVCYELDISNESSIIEFFQNTVDNFGRLDVLINNAWPKTNDLGLPFEEVKAESLYKNLCAHAGGYFLCCQHGAHYMKKQQAGVILNMGSIYGVVGPHFPIYENTDMTSPAAYALIKGGVHTFTKYLATYLAPFNIRVNCIAPGGILNSVRQAPAFVDNYKSKTPLGRMGEPEDIVGPTIFLISEASRYVTGEILMVDGGWTAW
jgi:NAD(P)-dependent dehydrogenase (short-subunit alcohol dehydrogenase family)